MKQLRHYHLCSYWNKTFDCRALRQRFIQPLHLRLRRERADVIAIVDGSKTQLVEYTYDAWGKILTRTGTLAAPLGTLNPFRWRGYVYDVETNLYYLRSRYYSPPWHKFLNADSTLGKPGQLLGHNVFAYCRNNPVNYHDPSGKFTYSYGIEGEAAWMFKVGGNVQLATDDNSNLRIINCVSAGGGTPSASLCLVVAVTNADTIFDLKGTGLSAGGSYILGIDAIVGTARDGTTVLGAQFSYGFSTPIPEGHGQLAFTSVSSLNWLPPFIKDPIIDDISSKYNSLPQEVIDEIETIINPDIYPERTTRYPSGESGSGRRFLLQHIDP